VNVADADSASGKNKVAQRPRSLSNVGLVGKAGYQSLAGNTLDFRWLVQQGQFFTSSFFFSFFSV